jgi:GST-like protein
MREIGKIDLVALMPPCPAENGEIRHRKRASDEFVAGALSVADFAILGWAWRHERHKVDLADFPHVGRWYEALMARPGVKRGFEVKLD